MPAGRPTFPIPKTFVADAASLTLSQLSAQHCVSQSLISRWRKRCNVKVIGGKRKMPVPDDYLSFAHLTTKELADKFGVSRWTIYKWKRTSGFVPNFSKKPPDDFLELSKTMRVVELRTHYRAGYSTIAAWRKQLGITKKLGRRKAVNTSSEKENQ
jgi:Helix-turn-helix of insertion element transposase